MVDYGPAFARLDQFIAQHIAEMATPGLALAITNTEYTFHLATYGYADLAACLPISPTTLFEIGSIGKSMTAIVVLQLAAAGRLDLHAPVERYLPWFHVPSAYAPITVHHLLSHTAGIPSGTDFVPSARYEVYALRDLETAYPPGERFHYSNVGYKAPGYLLEEVLDKPYGEILQRQLLDPLGMVATEAITTHETHKRLAVGYQRLYDDRPVQPPDPLIPAPWLEISAGDGSPAVPADDLARYARMLLNRGALPQGRLLEQAGFDLLAQRVVPVRTGASRFYRFYGYGLYSVDRDGHQVMSHGGETVGYNSALLADLDEGIGVVVLCNGPGRPGAIGRYALQLIQAAQHGQPLPDLLAAREPTRIEGAADYAGRYHAGSRTITLAAEDSRLLLQQGERVSSLEQRGPDAFMVGSAEFSLHLLRFGRQAEQVTEAWYGNERYQREGYGESTTPALPADWSAYPGQYRAHNPWVSNFWVFVRRGELFFTRPTGEEMLLVPLAPGIFRLGETPERLQFDSIVNGQALRARFSGADYYRQGPPFSK